MFKINSKFKPAGDQPKSIDKLIKGIRNNKKYQTLLGVTGSGKTFTMANIIEAIQKPTLVIAHNKTLAAQLCNEFRCFFPNNSVEYFVSYYDYYQPEAYLPRSDTYIEKETQINDEIDRLRHATTSALSLRRDVIIVASVSCIYGLGSPKTYKKEIVYIEKNKNIKRNKLMRKLINLHFTRTNISLKRGQFRSRGNVIEINPIDIEIIYRVELEKDKVKNIVSIDPLTNNIKKELPYFWIFPAKHFITPKEEIKRAEKEIKKELKERLFYFKKNNLPLEAERLKRKTNFDLEMIREIGYCNGIENYSRHLTGRKPNIPPSTLLSYFPKDFLMFIDESHVTIPQIGGMYNGDKARKKNLIEYGFRLPSAYDNRPLKFLEFEKKIKQCIFVSATPAQYEIKKSAQIVQQIIRPTGLLDPKITVKPITSKKNNLSQVDDLIEEIKKRIIKKERILVTTLTKKMAEVLSEYLAEQNISSRYLHSNIDTLERIKILTQLRKGNFDCLVGVNLLREGLDLPEVSLVAVLDADKEGFLRSETSLIQTIGRASRNVNGEVILYADYITGSLSRAISKTNKRRKKQIEYNKKYNIKPQTIKKKIKDITDDLDIKKVEEILDTELKADFHKKEEIIKRKEKEMIRAAKNLEFELATLLRDQINLLKKRK